MSKVLSEAVVKSIREELRFRGIKPVNNRKGRSLSSCFWDTSDLYAKETESIKAALQGGADGRSVEALEEEMAGFAGVKGAVALCSGTAAVHTALRLAAERVYGGGNHSLGDRGLLSGHRVFCSDLTSSAMVNPVVCEGGEPVFIDASPDDWGMDPDALETAFEKYPDVRIAMMAHVYGFPGQAGKIKKICEKHGALLIEDACESLGAAAGGKRTGSFGDYGVLGFHHDDMMPETEGGILLVNDFSEAEKVRNRMRRPLPGCSWEWQGVPGYGRRMGDAEAEIIRSRMRCLDWYIEKKKAVYERYRKSFQEDLMQMNPVGEGTEPNYRTPCMTVESGIGFIETRCEREYEYVSQHGTAAPMEILEALEAFGAEGRPVWKPMHMQPLFKNCDQISPEGSKKDYESSGHNSLLVRCSESAEIFRKGICLPADIGMTEEEQDRVTDIIFACYNRREMDRGIWCAV